MTTAGRPASVLVHVLASGIVAALYFAVTVFAMLTAVYGAPEARYKSSSPSRSVLGWRRGWDAKPWRDGHDLSVPALAIGATVGLGLTYAISYALGEPFRRGIIRSRLEDPFETILLSALWILGPFLGALGHSLFTARRKLGDAAERPR